MHVNGAMTLYKGQKGLTAVMGTYQVMVQVDSTSSMKSEKNEANKENEVNFVTYYISTYLP